MKKFFKSIAVFAVIALSFSCAKENHDPEESIQPKTFEYTFRVSSAENNDATKTVIDGTVMKWEENDKIAVFAEGSVNRFGQIKTISPSVIFPVYLDAALTEGSKIYAYYPYSSSNSSTTADAVNLVIPSSQTGDADAMPQVALPYTTTEDLAKDTHNIGDLYFCNLGSVIRFLVYSASGTYAGETVNYIKFNADKAIAGSFTFDLTAVDYADQNSMVISGYTATDIKLKASPAIGSSTSNAGAADMVIAPGTYYGTIVVDTDVARYTYDIASGSAITFPRSSIQRIGLNLESAACTRVEKHPVEVYIPATSITVGDKVLFAGATSGDTKVFGYDKGNNRNAVAYSISDGMIVTNEDMYPLILGDGGTANYYTLYDWNYDGYVSAMTSGSSNYMKTLDAVDGDNSKWQIIIDAESKATKLEATNSEYTKKYLRFNSGSSLFSCYNSGTTQNDIYVFKQTTSTIIAAADQDIAYDVTSVVIPYNVYNGSGATTYNVKTNPGSCATDFVHNTGTKQISFNITSNSTGAARTVEIEITNNSITKTVSIIQAAEPVQLVMSAITTTPSATQIVFNWSAVDNATGYQISINGGTSYSATQAATSYTWTGLTTFTEHTIKVKAIGDGVYYLDSDPASKTQRTSLVPPTDITWTQNTNTASWTDNNTAAGTYGDDYKYQYTIDDGANYTDVAAPGTSVTLVISETKVIKVKTVYISDNKLNSVPSTGVNCTIGDTHYYTKVSTITSGGKYLIVGHGSSKVMIPSTGSGRKSSANVTISTNKIESTAVIDGYAVTITKNGTSYDITFKVGSTTYYLNYGGSSTNLATATSTEKKWDVTLNPAHGDFAFRDHDTNTRGLIFRGGSTNQFGGYATSNLNGTEYYDVDLYKYE